MQFSQWLKEQLEGLVSVQRCMLGQTNNVGMRTREPDLVVYMWTGVRVHIYTLMEETKTRTIKSIIQADSGTGVGSLFIIAPHLVPQDDMTIVPPEWLMAIHALSHDRIYTYTTNGEPRLLQLHFGKAGLAEQRKVLYGPPVTIRQLRYSRVTIKPSYIKGFWMVADFGNHAFWKDDAEHYQPPPRAQYGYRRKENPPNSQQAQSRANRGFSNHKPPPAKTHLELSYELLGVELSATRDEVKAAFRKLAFKLHPDVSDLEKAEAEARFKLLSEAYEYIKAERKW